MNFNIKSSSLLTKMLLRRLSLSSVRKISIYIQCIRNSYCDFYIVVRNNEIAKIYLYPIRCLQNYVGIRHLKRRR